MKKELTKEEIKALKAKKQKEMNDHKIIRK
jgi:hypothetical protein